MQRRTFNGIYRIDFGSSFKQQGNSLLRLITAVCNPNFPSRSWADMLDLLSINRVTVWVDSLMTARCISVWPCSWTLDGFASRKMSVTATIKCSSFAAKYKAVQWYWSSTNTKASCSKSKCTVSWWLSSASASSEVESCMFCEEDCMLLFSKFLTLSKSSLYAVLARRISSSKDKMKILHVGQQPISKAA